MNQKILQVISSYSAGQLADLSRINPESLAKTIRDALMVGGNKHGVRDLSRVHQLKISHYDRSESTQDTTPALVITDILRVFKRRWSSAGDPLSVDVTFKDSPIKLHISRGYIN